MNIYDELSHLFHPDKNQEISIDDKISSFKLSYTIQKFQNVSSEALSSILSKISNRDSPKLTIRFGEGDPLIVKSAQGATRFAEEISKELGLWEDELCRLSFEISKDNNTHHRTIYHKESFEKFWEQIKILDLLEVLKEIFSKFGKVHFTFAQDNDIVIGSRFLLFGKGKLNSNEGFKIKQAKELCHFGNYESYPFHPKCFYLDEHSNSSPYNKKIETLNLIFSITSIFDITSIEDNHLIYKVNGFKSVSGKVSIERIDSSLSRFYYQIVEWIYSDSGHISDKLGLARNILTLYLKDSSLKIEANVFVSIQSGYKTYLQENVSKYIEIRGKIHDELDWISQKSGDIVEKYLSNYQKSIFTFLSFFISVFVLRALSNGKFTNVFTKDATLLSLGFLGISTIFLIFSFWNLEQEKKRLIRKYQNIKDRYNDLLVSDDIEQILQGDEEFKYELSFINKRRNSYTFLWVVTVIILFTIILHLSSIFIIEYHPRIQNLFGS